MISNPAGPRFHAPLSVPAQRPTLSGSVAVFLCLLILAVFFLVSPLIAAQGSPKITAVDPTSGKVNDSVSVSGEALGKDTVAAIFLSDDKSDYKATIVSQAADKIVMKIPQVKAGGYNVSIQVGNGILIEPVRFTVQE